MLFYFWQVSRWEIFVGTKWMPLHRRKGTHLARHDIIVEKMRKTTTPVQVRWNSFVLGHYEGTAGFNIYKVLKHLSDPYILEKPSLIYSISFSTKIRIPLFNLQGLFASTLWLSPFNTKAHKGRWHAVWRRVWWQELTKWRVLQHKITSSQSHLFLCWQPNMYWFLRPWKKPWYQTYPPAWRSI